MRLWLVVGALGLAAGCSFERAGLPVEQGDDDDDTPLADARVEPTVDARPMMIDAAIPCTDDDADGICNGDDDWPCGVKPQIALPASTADGDLGASVLALLLDGGSNVMTHGPGGDVILTTSTRLRDSNDSCMQCSDQVELGFAGEARVHCFDYGNVPQDTDQFRNTLGVQIPVPTTPGRHDLTFQIAQANNCNSEGGDRRDGWYQRVPTTPIIGAICVH